MLSKAKLRFITIVALWLLLFNSSCGFASTTNWVPASDVHSVVPLRASLEYLIDPTGRMSINDVIEKKESFAKIVKEDLNFPTVNGAVWVKFSADFSNYKEAYWYLIQNYEHVGVMQVYYWNRNKYQVQDLSENSAMNDRIYAVHNYIFKLPVKDLNVEYYLRYLPQGHNVVVDLAWSNEYGLIASIAKNHLEEGLFFGPLGVMWVYNLFLYLYLRDKNYLYYIYYLGAFIATFIYIDGFMPYIFGFSKFKEKIFSMFPFFALHGMVVFGRNLIDIKNDKTLLSKYLLFFQYVSLACALTPFVLPRGHSFNVANILIISILPALFVAGGWRAMRQYKPAFFYFIGWSIFALALCLLALKSLLIIPESWLTDYSIKFAAVWEAIIFSFALGYRLRLQEKVVRDEIEGIVNKLRIALEREKIAVKKNVQFIAAVNHELRSPIQRLINGYDMIALECGLEESDHRILGLRRVANQIISQMKDIGDFSRLEAAVLLPRMEEFALNDLLSDISEDFTESILSKNVKIKVVGKSNGEVIYADFDRVRQVVANLIQNAIKFTDEGEISVLGEVLVSNKLELPCDGILKFTIDDSGRGIPAEDLENIFEPFWQGRARDDAAGSGLGLAIVKRLVDLLHGSVSVRSIAGSGTTFVVEFPTKIIETNQSS